MGLVDLGTVVPQNEILLVVVNRVVGKRHLR